MTWSIDSVETDPSPYVSLCTACGYVLEADDERCTNCSVPVNDY